MMRVALFINQGVDIRMSFYAGIARHFMDSSDIEPVLVVWTRAEAQDVGRYGVTGVTVVDFESWVRSQAEPTEADIDRLTVDYPDVNWSEVIAAERSFTDYSMLLRSTGDRRESLEYVRRLLHNIVRFIEHVLTAQAIQVMACPTGDTLFTLAGFKVARKHRVPTFAESAAWLLEPGATGGGFFTADEYMRCPRMIRTYQELLRRPITDQERASAGQMARGITAFSGKTAFAAKNKGARAGMTALSPNVSRLFHYLRENRRRDKNVDYTQFEVWEKVTANLRRLIRKQLTRSAMGSRVAAAIPSRSVFFALHYQPEQSTLAQGIWYANQIALVENISKSLPLGYTLVVKEHPWGRGNRSRWQYRHLSRLYNVVFCDAPAKEIVRRSEAVIAVAGTIAIESLVLDRPTVLLGRGFFDFSSLYYKVTDIAQLPQVLRAILIDRHYDQRTDRDTEICRFLLAYRSALVPAFPVAANASMYAEALLREVAADRAAQQEGTVCST